MLILVVAVAAVQAFAVDVGFLQSSLTAETNNKHQLCNEVWKRMGACERWGVRAFFSM